MEFIPMVRLTRKKTNTCLKLFLGIILVSVISLLFIIKVGSTMKTIPGWLLAPQISENERFTRFHPLEFSVPIPHKPIPQHPFMATGSNSNMHNDASMSDSYEASGPLGI